MSSQALNGFLPLQHVFALCRRGSVDEPVKVRQQDSDQQRGIDVTPLNPKESEIEGLKTLPSPSDLPSPGSTSVSFVTPPAATLSLLQTVFSSPSSSHDIAYAWLQPGAEDAKVAQWIRDNKLSDRVIFGGPCVLVIGDGLREEQKAKAKKASL